MEANSGLRTVELVLALEDNLLVKLLDMIEEDESEDSNEEEIVTGSRFI